MFSDANENTGCAVINRDIRSSLCAPNASLLFRIFPAILFGASLFLFRGNALLHSYGREKPCALSWKFEASEVQ